MSQLRLLDVEAGLPSTDGLAQRAAEFCETAPHRQDPFGRRNWGGTLHSLCSYQGKLKPAIGHADPTFAAKAVEINFGGLVSACLVVADRLEKQGYGTLVLMSSVAGLRARKDNFVYGSTKAGLDAFAQGLGDSLHGRGVRVVVVRPGFVRTKMTEGMDAAPFSTTPDKVAELIVAGLAKGKEESCIISQSACWACWRSVFGISTSW